MAVPVVPGVLVGLLALAPAPPYLPPSGAQVRGQRAVRTERVGADAVALSARADGSLLYEDPGGRFKASVAPDGTVTFADRWRRPAARRRQAKRERGTAGGVPAGGMLPAVNGFAGVPVAGPTEWGFRLRGHDPAVAAKAQFLAHTAELRTQMATTWARQQLRVALDAMEDELQRLWADPALSPDQKRAAVFARWDELADAPRPDPRASALDRLRASYGQRARRRVEAFVRRQLPAGSADAFAPSELQALNRQRRSQSAFTPYRPVFPTRAASSSAASPRTAPPSTPWSNPS